MAETALIEEIRRQADIDIEAAWHTARADADAFKEGCVRAIEDARRRASNAIDAKTRALEAEATGRAQATARRIHAAAHTALAARLNSVAVEALARFRRDEYPALFEALVRDLPPRNWPRVIVHPDDEQLATIHFPEAHIVCDPSVESGVVVETEDGRVRVTNTLRARLDVAWADLSPAIIRDVRDALPKL